MWNFINTEIVNRTQTQNITHTMVTHNNESALTVVVPLPPRSPLDVKTSLHDMRIFKRFVQNKEETKIVHHCKRKKKKKANKQTNSHFSSRKIQMFGYSSVGSLKDDSFAVETFLYNICAGTDHGIKANSTSSFPLNSFK